MLLTRNFIKNVVIIRSYAINDSNLPDPRCPKGRGMLVHDVERKRRAIDMALLSGTFLESPTRERRVSRVVVPGLCRGTQAQPYEYCIDACDRRRARGGMLELVIHKCPLVPRMALRQGTCLVGKRVERDKWVVVSCLCPAQTETASHTRGDAKYSCRARRRVLVRVV